VKTNQPFRIGIVVVAYNAAATLAHVLDRIPDDLRKRVEVVLVCDDHSVDGTYEVGQAYQRKAPELPVEVIRRPRNLGYGGNQKASYRWAIEYGLDIVVLLHGDGQYAPECMGDLLAPLETGECDAVFGSRMLDRGSARRGGMPFYKFIGNRILTGVENRIVGLSLSEWHSGYRAYSINALRAIPFESNSDGFNFDTQIIIQLCEANQRIIEVPISTYYGDEICYVNGMHYAVDVVTDVLRYKANKVGFGTGNLAFASRAYDLKVGDNTSHVRILESLTEEPRSKVLDLGCSDGKLSAQFRELGHHVTGIDIEVLEGVEDAVDRFITADLDAGIPENAGTGYDVVVAGDVLEHVRRPDELLRDIRACLTSNGTVLASIPNFAHWYPRLRVVLGLFDYDRRGILDSTHLRFFTRRSFERLVHEAGFVVAHCQPIGIPTEVFGERDEPRVGNASSEQPRRFVAALFDYFNTMSVRLRPNLFASQYVYKLAPQSAPTIADRDRADFGRELLPIVQETTA
jgi:glycosyltransferase involved in cell wall biosynthesis